MAIAVNVEGLGKQYRLGLIGTGTFVHDLNRWWHHVRGKADPYLKVTDVNDRTKKGGEYVWALRDVSFNVEQGETVGIIGRNGAGKSTLLKILSRTTAPTTGHVRIKGRMASLLEVGTGFHPELTGRENIFLNGAILGMSKSEISLKLDEIIDFAGVERFVDTPVKRYSSGMYVRLAFAVAANLEPDILVVDEVLAVGDAEFQNKALGKMQSVSRNEGRTVLFVSHNMAAVENLCRKSILLKNGTLVESGPTRDVIDSYLRTDSSQNLDLSEYKDRRGLGLVRFVGVDFLDNGTRNVDSLKSGMHSTIRLHYLLKDGLEQLKNCRISLAILRETSPLIVFSSELTVRNGIHLKKKGTIDFVVNELPLSEGMYDLILFIEGQGDVQDWLTLHKHLSVVDGDFYGTGINYPTGWQGRSVLVRHKLIVD